MHRLESDYWGTIDFVYLDREKDANKSVVEKFGIFGQPVFVLLDAQGNEVQRWFGVISADGMRVALASFLAG